MREKKGWKKRIVSMLLAFVMVLTQIGVWGGTEVVKADTTELFTDGDLGDDTGDNLWSGNWQFWNETWSACNKGSIAYSPYAANDATSGLGINFDNSGTVTMYQAISSLSAGTYKMTGYVKDDKDKGGTIQLLSGTSVTEDKVTLTNSFQQFSFEFTLPEDQSGSYNVGVSIASGAGAWVCLDTLSLTKNESSEETDSSESDSENEDTDESEDNSSSDGNLFNDGDMGDSLNLTFADDGKADFWREDTNGNNTNIWQLGDSDSTWEYLGTDNPIGYSKWAKYDGESGLGISFNDGSGTISMYQTIASLAAGNYRITGYIKETVKDEATIQAYYGDSTSTTETLSANSTFSQFTFDFKLDNAQTDYKVGFLITAEKGAWVCLDTFTLTALTDEQIQQERTQALADLKSIIDTYSDANAYTTDSYAVFKSTLDTVKAFYESASAEDSETTTAEILAETEVLTTAADSLVAASVVQSSVIVDKLDLSDDFIKGVDVSSYISEVNSGVTYYDYDGQQLDGAGFFKLLADSGVNWVRIRVWNDPYLSTDSTKGYGGGNNDLAKAKEIGKLATDAGLKVLIDFHYSDFWADPSKQTVPKAWKAMTLAEKTQAVYDYTYSSLTDLHNAGVNVRMVQIGNETNNGICGETDWANRAKIYNAGSSAVRAYEETIYGSSSTVTDGSEVMVALHFTEPNTGIQATIAENLKKYGVDYDVFATSYYPFWHGTLSNLQTVLSGIAATYNKKVMVAETSYAYTFEDGDGHENNVRADKASSLTLDYTISVQGQVDAVSSIMKTLSKTTNGIGLFYWEPAWIPVQVYDKDADNAKEVLASNKEKWEANGSGWASSYSYEYDPTDAGLYYGGSSWDNQALFDNNGHPLESLRVFKYVETGATAEVKLDGVKSISCVFNQGDTYTLPETVTGVYNDGSTEEISVTWDAAQVAALGEIGTTSITGTAGGFTAICNVEILPPENLLTNGDFEDGLGDGNGWVIGNDKDGIIKVDTKDVKRGDNALKFDAYSTKADKVTVSQTVTNAKAGVYSCFMNVEGQGTAETYTVTLSVTVNGEAVTDEAELKGWLVWDKVELTGIQVTSGDDVTVTITVTTTEAGVWGTIDDVFLYRTGSLSSNSSSGSSYTGTTSSSSATTTPSTPAAGTTATEVSAETASGKTVTATVTVTTDETGAVSEATAEVATTEKKISGDLVAKIVEAAGTSDVEIMTTVTTASGKTKYTVTANAQDLTAGTELKVFIKDAETGKYKLVNAKTYTVGEDGSVSVKLSSGQSYQLLNKTEAASVEKAILKTVKAAKSSAAVKKGKTTKLKMSAKLDMDNVKKITYKSSKKSVAKVSKTGKITAKKKGTTTIKATVTLKNGVKKTVKMKIKVK